MSYLKWLNANLERVLIASLLAGMVLLISANVFMRYVMNASLSWGEELTLWIFVWFIWLSVSYAFHRRDHVRITIFKTSLSDRKQLWLELVVDLAVLAFLCILSLECIKLIMAPFVAHQKSVVLGFPIPILYASAPVGALLSSFRIAQNILKTVRQLVTPNENGDLS